MYFCDPFIGLSSQQALNKLISDIHGTLQLSCCSFTGIKETDDACTKPITFMNKWKWCCNIRFLKRTFGLGNQTSLFPWTALVISLLHFVILILYGGILAPVS